MPTHSKRLRNGVQELIRTEGTTLEDLHVVATDVIETLDKMAARFVRRLKPGQAIRCYNEDSNKEYGQRGSDLRCYFGEYYETQVRGATLRVYDAKREWSISVDCLLQVFDEFDPESVEGKKRAKKAKPRKKGRRRRKKNQDVKLDESETQWAPPQEPEYEPEELDEEYTFNSSENYEEYFDDV